MEDKIEEKEDFSLPCAKCGTTPNDVLIMGCNHNLCIVCAAKNLYREQLKANKPIQVRNGKKVFRKWHAIYAMELQS